MSQRSLTIVILSALILTFAANAFAESLERPVRRSQTRGSAWHGESLQGRTILRVHAGLSVPTGDTGDAFQSGFGMGGSVGYGVGRNVLLSWGVSYHRFDRDLGGGHLAVTPVTMNADVAIPTSGTTRFWMSGGLGFYHVSEAIPGVVALFGPVTISDSENDVGMNFGMGITTPISPRTAFGAGFKVHHVFGSDFPDTDFLTFQAGVGLPL